MIAGSVVGHLFVYGRIIRSIRSPFVIGHNTQ